jgi:hypothetical protein
MPFALCWYSRVFLAVYGLKRCSMSFTQRIAHHTGLSTTSQSVYGLARLLVLLIWAPLAAGLGSTLQSPTSALCIATRLDSVRKVYKPK